MLAWYKLTVDVKRIGSPLGEKQEAPIFVGEVLSQPLVADEAARVRVAAITVRDGARTRLHHHDFDQVLVITDGLGILAGEAKEHHVQPGDVVFVPRGERHWHGAEPGGSMTHLSINEVGTTSLDESADP